MFAEKEFEIIDRKGFRAKDLNIVNIDHNIEISNMSKNNASLCCYYIRLLNKSFF